MLPDSDLQPMWTPSQATIDSANVTAFTAWVNARFGLSLASYPQLWEWSVADIDRFWRAVWEYFKVGAPLPEKAGLADVQMPGTQWFPGVTLNFAEQVLARAPSEQPAIIHFDAALNQRAVSREELTASVLQLADALRRAGIGQGDRVVACLPNVPETMIAMLACASIGAIWSVVSPETGAEGMLARFAQLEPKLLIAVDGYRFRDNFIDRSAEIEKVAAGLPTLQQVIVLPQGRNAVPAGFASRQASSWDEFVAQGRPCTDRQAFDFAQVPFAHPLWVLFSSGTTGIPKAMLQSHGGILLEMLKNGALHLDLRSGDRLFFYTITGWMIWNLNFGALLSGVAVILYDGHPAEPGPGQLWRIAELGQATTFGASPSYLKVLMQAGYRPAQDNALAALRLVLLSGSPATPECMHWLLDAVKPDLWIQSACGGTDVCTCFVGGVPTLPVYAGEIQARCLGVDMAVLDDDGKSIVDDVGELVIRQPMPSMPVRFWGDTDNQRYRDTYFDAYPGQWRQGDFATVNQRGGVHVLGRSDATLNRQGVRIGTAEIYRSLEALPEIADTLVVNVDLPGGEFWMPLFVRLHEGVALDDALAARIRQHLKTTLSPRHVPDAVIEVAGIPYTKTGKRLEVPVRRILCGTPVEKAIAREAVENFQVLDSMIAIAQQRLNEART
ncbi:MAG: acetoacetate--CoA ligase [Pseudoxanthomonas sp.]